MALDTTIIEILQAESNAAKQLDDTKKNLANTEHLRENELYNQLKLVRQQSRSYVKEQLANYRKTSEELNKTLLEQAISEQKDSLNIALNRLPQAIEAVKQLLLATVV